MPIAHSKVIYFVHGNGFPSFSYRKMLDRLKQHGYSVYGIDKMGHSSTYPITQNWSFLVDELIDSIERDTHHLKMPVIAVGHSMGGVLSLMASVKRPDLFQSVVTLDSFLVGQMKLKILHMAKYIGGIEYLTPAGRTKHRRDHWENEKAFRQYCESRPFFQQLDPECLDDYLACGISQQEKGWSLAFEREKEYDIYCTLPHYFSVFKQKNPALKVPAALIYGRQSEILKKSDIRAVQKLYQMKCFEIQGTHMFPLEHPLECADKIHHIIEEDLF